jgi:CubicO group peptidase (beta-lactamase class C family)
MRPPVRCLPFVRWLTLLALFAGCATQHAVAQQNARDPAVLSSEARAAIASFHAEIARDVEEDNVGGMTVAVVLGNEVVSAKAFGWADKEKKIPADIETIYRIGSISKSFTAVALVQLAEKGVLDLDDPVEKYLPEIKNLDGYTRYPPITFRQLASHTAGLIREPKLENAASGPIDQWENKILASIPTTSYSSPPGEKYQYSNIGFGILGLAISRAAQKPFMELLHELIFAPLKMKHSAFIPTSEMKKHLAGGYANRADGSIDADLPAREHAGRGYKVPNGGIYTTVGDLARFIASQTGASPVQILSEKSLEEIQRIQTPESEAQGYGLGFFVEIGEDGIKTVGHGGSVAGYNVYHAFAPEFQIGVILFRNYNRGKTNLQEKGSELLRKIALAQKENN